jgi:membrane associated rhomboid family serine protease
MDFLMQAPVTLTLIALNVVVSMIGFQNRAFFEQNAFWVAPIRQQGQWHRFIVSAFLHVNTLHLLVNMYVLYEFGGVLEHILGPVGFLALYVASLLAGNVWEYVANFNKADYRAVGASGATSGVILGFCLLYPFAMLGLFFIIPVWAIVAGVGFIIISFLLSQRDNTLIAHGAHLGGALAGGAVTLFLVPGAWGNLVAQITDKLG